MEYGVFSKLVNDCKEKEPILFGLEHDEILSIDEIEEFEEKIHIELPEKYKKFLSEYGGGYFGYANVYSLDEGSDFYLLHYNDVPVGKYLRIADNGCGDYYLLLVDDKKCSEQLYFYEHDEAAVCAAEYADILEYLVKEGLGIKGSDYHDLT
ncbi:MAG: SMI1/KNR4 family protein [Lachnospiraceae bacterium]|nr:SMI1/KNR4 family protein [Lachnospiraceae bacterium]